MKNIYLVGFMGSGKSTIGKILAKKLNMKFIDIDEEIERIEGMKISQIFEKKGEKYFRDLEKKLITEFIKRKGYVVSTGGGLGADINNMENMKKNGVVVWLDVPLDIILKRTKKDKTERPLLNQPVEKIKELYENRKKIYKMADIHIKAKDKSPDEISQEIIKQWKSILE
jgi:shikimate kinase